jgi:tripartite-type tricarboxylate transporter receptor subunit TctC
VNNILAVMASALLAFSALPVAAQSEEFPTKPIRIIVPTAAGGAADFVARVLADKVQSTIGQPVIVEARPGANGNLGASVVLEEPADGYNVMMGHIGLMTINQHLYPDMTFDPLKDFTAVVKTVSYGNLLAVHPSVPVKSVAELIAYAKENPAKLQYSSSGIGGSFHMAMELFKLQAGVDILHVPFQGTSPALNALMGKHVDVAFTDQLVGSPQVAEGTIRGLATSGKERSPVLPDLPTVAESGLVGFDVEGWNGIVVKAGTPADRIAILNDHFNRALRDPEVIKKLTQQGALVAGGTPEEFATFMQGEFERWGDVVKKAGIEVE